MPLEQALSDRVRQFWQRRDPATCGPAQEHVPLVTKPAGGDARAGTGDEHDPVDPSEKGCCSALRKASEKLTGRTHGGKAETCGQRMRMAFAWFMLLWTFGSQAGSIFQLVKIDNNPDNARDISFVAQLIWTCSAFFWFNYAMWVHERPDVILAASTGMSFVLNVIILQYVARSGNRGL